MKVLAAMTAGALAATAHAAESTYPSRSVRLIIPFAPGGGLDLAGRTIAPKLSAAMGQTWVVDNRSGAAGNLGAEALARAAPDGHTVMFGLNTQLTANPTLYKLSFDVEKDLQPVTLIGTSVHVVLVHPSVPAKTFKDFLALAKQKPGQLNYASAGAGSAIHMASELLKLRAGIDLTHIAYKGGGPAAAAVLAGESQVLVGTSASVLPYVTAGRMRALATTGPKRSKVFPDLPTVEELGYPGFDTSQWYGAFVPSGTPGAVVDRIRSELHKVLQQPDIQAALASQGVDLDPGTSQALAARIKTETATWAAVIKAAGIRAE
ncbi:MAG: tripartite tricarboxylate transporter substrate binding protein [Burkholderiales bacterium]|nr:tripartite tricarboxylate transporter substrate binding protein [Burkholderiales bacterium]